MSGKQVAGSIIGSIIGSVAVMTLLTMFVMPILLPGMQTILLQSKYMETSSSASIPDTQTTYQQILDMELTIDIQENSRILITFTAEGSLTIGSTFTGVVNFYVAIVIESVSNRTSRIHFYDGTPGGFGAIREIPVNLHNIYQSERLPKGVYNIVIYWKSDADATGTNSLNLSTPAGNRTRSLLLQELL